MRGRFFCAGRKHFEEETEAPNRECDYGARDCRDRCGGRVVCRQRQRLVGMNPAEKEKKYAIQSKDHRAAARGASDGDCARSGVCGRRRNRDARLGRRLYRTTGTRLFRRRRNEAARQGYSGNEGFLTADGALRRNVGRHERKQLDVRSEWRKMWRSRCRTAKRS